MLQPPNHIKSFQSIYSLRTHKFIKLEMEKEEFFEQLTRKLQSELSQEELQFLMEYILKDKFNEKAQNRLFRNTNTSNKQREEREPTIDCIQSDVFSSFKDIIKRRKFNNISIAQEVHTFSRKGKHGTKHHTQVYKPCYSDDKHTRVSQFKPTQTSHIYNNNSASKFHKMSLKFKDDDREEKSTNKENWRRGWNIERELPSKAAALKMISRQYLLKNYKNSFISNIFDRPSKQHIEPTVDESFQDNFNNRATQQIQRHKNTQMKYRHLTSIRFERSPRKQPPLKVHHRRF